MRRVVVLALVLVASGAYAQRFPSTVMVRHQQWLVTYFPDGDTRRGETICEEHGIQIQRALSLAEEQDTLLHELLHAEACNVGGAPYYNTPSDFDIQHAGINHIPSVVLDILQENPELLQYFAPGPPETTALKDRDTEH